MPFCAYCRQHQESGDGFKRVPHLPSGTWRSMCPRCQEVRRKPRYELQRLADQERQARKGPAK